MRLLAALLLLPFAAPASAADAFALNDGDRVVFLGNTLLEREQRGGYWELALTTRFPGKDVTYRNLGWSGDTVFGEARAGFGTAADGFKHLKEHVLALKPAVIVVGYGAVEAFDGADGLPKFGKGLDALLDALAPTKARVVLLSPLRQEDLGKPLPDPAAQNKRLRLYADALKATAKKRDHVFIDLYDLLGDGAKATPPAPLTDNGLHPTPWGYWRSAAALEKGLGLPARRWRLDVDAAAKKATAVGAKAGKVITTGALRFTVTDAMLPTPPPPKEGAPKKSPSGAERVLCVKGLKPGSYALTVDGQEVATATAAAWAAGVALARGPEFEQAEKLRAAVRAKNELYFHRWRPQNVTYLFGFRKHEQGKNAAEIPKFDPLVAAKEEEVAKLRAPAARAYELKPVK